MLSRVFVARGISCLTSSGAVVHHKLQTVSRNPIRIFSTETQQEEETSLPTEVETIPKVETIKEESLLNTAVKEEKEIPSNSESAEEGKSADIDKQFLEDLLSSISVETKTEKQRKQLVFDFATLMMDPSFKQLYNSLSKSLPPQYFTDKGLVSTIKKEFIARVQEEIISGSFLPLSPDPSLQGLDEKKRSMVKDNKIIQTADSENIPLDLPIPTWIWEEVMGKSEEKVEGDESVEVKGDDSVGVKGDDSVGVKGDESMGVKGVESVNIEDDSVKAESTQVEGENSTQTEKTINTESPNESTNSEKPKKNKVEHYDTLKNSPIEEMLDTYGDWPFKEPEELKEEKKVRGAHHTGSFITKNIIINKAGQRIAYGGGTRKDSIARVYIRSGTGKIDINGKSLLDAFPMGHNRDHVLAPLAVTLTFQKFDIHAIVNGGGTTGQSQAIRIALSKALSHYDPSYSVLLSKAGLLTTDTRKVESKKPGHRKARKPQQWVKR